jgi:hypothetical protein
VFPRRQPARRPFPRRRTGADVGARPLRFAATIAALCFTLVSAAIAADDPKPAAGPARPYFRDVTQSSGMAFVHRQGKNLIYMPDTSSPGVAMLDYDSDGFQDVFLLQGSGPEHTHDPAKMPESHLYRTMSGPEFDEVAAPAGIASRGWGQSCLAWDIDNDGYEDLMLTHYQEPQKLFRNNGDGTFREVAKSVGLSAEDLVWASSLTALDFDRDGWLDVYVGQYLRCETEDLLENPPLKTFQQAGARIEGVPMTMVPEFYDPLEKRLYRSLQGARFADVTAATGVADPTGKTYGAVACDLDLDGWTDLFLANDASVCELFRNEEGRRFSARAKEAWVAENRGAMGLAVGDVNLDGAPDLVVSHWLNPPAVYRNFVDVKKRRRLSFADRAGEMGLSRFMLVGWGVGFLDVDNDSLEDLLQINGLTKPDPARPGKLIDEPAHLWRMTPARVFELVGPEADGPVHRPRAGRSAAFGDLDLDGSVDVVVGNNNERAEVWAGDAGSHAWVGVVLSGTASNRDAYGAHLTLTQGARVRVEQLTSGESYYASNAHQILFGLGTDEAPVACQVRWLSGRVERFVGLAVRRYHLLVEGTGLAAERSDAH